MTDTLLQTDPYQRAGFDLLKDIPRADGTGHNEKNTTLGGKGILYRNLTPPDYSDPEKLFAPAGLNRPSARLITNRLFSQLSEDPAKPHTGLSKPLPNNRNITDFGWSFGQFINHDIDLPDAPGRAEQNRPFPIPVPADDPVVKDKTELKFLREAFAPDTGVVSQGGVSRNRVPAAHTNNVTAWFDLSTVYGSDRDLQNTLRSKQSGRLKTSAGNLLPTGDPGNIDTTIPTFAGDIRSSENAALASTHTIWMREHNRLADQLALAHPDWDDEQIFQRARLINIGQFQAVIFNEWLPAIMGDGAISAYKGYDEKIDPQTTEVFAVAVLRFGHSAVSDIIPRIDRNGVRNDLGLTAAFTAATLKNNPQEVDNIMRGLSTNLMQEVDTKAVNGLHNQLFNFTPDGKLEQFGTDLTAINIQRGRDRGLTDYNTIRKTLGVFVPQVGIQGITRFDEITKNVEVQNILRELYDKTPNDGVDDVNNIDAFVGLLAEDHVAGSSLGPTNQAIMKLQFERLRDGDRFFYLNPIEKGGQFTTAEMAEIDKTRLSDIIRRNSGVQNIQSNVFKAATQAEINTPATLIFNITNNIFITQAFGELNLQFATIKDKKKKGSINQIGVFVVDDDAGKINGIAPGQAGYLQAALRRSDVIFSSGINSDAFTTTGPTSQLSFSSQSRLAFFMVKNSTTDIVLSDLSAGRTPANVFFSIKEANSDKRDRIKVKAVQNDFELGFDDDDDLDFEDLVIKTQVVQGNPTRPLGTFSGVETLIDLRTTVTTIVETDFVVNREAAFSNSYGFYEVDDASGRIGNVKPGDADYAKVAIGKRITASNGLPGGKLLAPFLIANATVEAFLAQNSTNQGNQSLPLAYFAFAGANPDKVDHVRALGNNAFAFEDMLGGGDLDFNDTLVQVKFKTV